jgi:hypothetical protein
MILSLNCASTSTLSPFPSLRQLLLAEEGSNVLPAETTGSKTTNVSS